jgi:WD40 repeat protein
VWDLAKTDIKPIVLPGEWFYASQAVALSADGRRLVSCAGGRVQLWCDLSDLKSGSDRIIRDSDMDIYAAALSADGRRLVTAGKDKMARIWDLSNLSAEPIVFRGHAGPIYAVGLGADGRRLVTASRDGTVRVWNFNLDELIDQAGRITGRNLTHEEWKQYFPGQAYRKTFVHLPEPKG